MNQEEHKELFVKINISLENMLNLEKGFEVIDKTIQKYPNANFQITIGASDTRIPFQP